MDSADPQVSDADFASLLLQLLSEDEASSNSAQPQPDTAPAVRPCPPRHPSSPPQWPQDHAMASATTTAVSCTAQPPTAGAFVKRQTSGTKRPGGSKLKDLERQLAKLQEMERLEVEQRAFYSARIELLETVVDVVSNQAARLKAIKAGLTFNPFAGLGTTPQELQSLPPAWMMHRHSLHCSSVAKKLTRLAPALVKWPYLHLGPDTATRWPSLGSTSTSSPFADAAPTQRVVITTSCVRGGGGVGDGAGVGSQGGPTEEELRVLRALVTEINETSLSWLYMFMVAPKMMLASSMHMSAVASCPTPDLRKLVTSGDALPVAPESHWVQVAASIPLFGTQKAQAAALLDILGAAKARIVSHRAALAAALAELQAMPAGQLPPAGLVPLGQSAEQAQLERLFEQVPLERPISQVPLEQAAAGLVQLERPAGSRLDRCTTWPPRSHPFSSAANNTRAARLSSTGSSTSSASACNSTHSSLGPHASVVWKTPQTLDEEAAIVEQLERTVVKEGRLCVLCNELVFNYLLTPVQLAVAAVNTLPFIPDGMALLHVLGAGA